MLLHCFYHNLIKFFRGFSLPYNGGTLPVISFISELEAQTLHDRLGSLGF